MRQVFLTLNRAREISFSKPADPRGFSREAEDHWCRSHGAASLGLRLLTDYLAARIIVLLRRSPSAFPFDTLLSGESHNGKKRQVAKFGGIPPLFHRRQGSHGQDILCACYGCVD